MEPEVHIVEKWLQLVHRCFTVTNVKATGNKEIDILAVNPRKNAYVHVECSCKVGHMLDITKRFIHKGKVYNNELEYFEKEKFEHANVMQRVKEFFGDKKYTKTLVVWDARREVPDLGSTAYYAASKYGIEIKPLTDLIYDLREVIKEEHRGHRDDILRLIELMIAEDEVWEKERAWTERDVKQTIKKQEQEKLRKAKRKHT